MSIQDIFRASYRYAFVILIASLIAGFVRLESKAEWTVYVIAVASATAGWILGNWHGTAKIWESEQEFTRRDRR